jgi:GntR family transcriptional regulator, transcriptional repressor for pyruvate dehydrogenase complex
MGSNWLDQSEIEGEATGDGAMRDRGQARGRVEAVMRQMETALLDGTWRAGTKLPAERLLAEQYDVARNTVREAIQRLAARGLVQSRRGAGVFVTDRLRTGFASPWGQLVADHPALRDDILEFRRVLEGATAYFAALRASDEDVSRIRELLGELERTRDADDKNAEADADARLHEAIAQASHNAMFLHLHTSVLGVLREQITLHGTGLREQNADASDLLLLQHRTLCDAILARRPEEARTAMQTHIDFVRARVGDDHDMAGSGWTTAPRAEAATEKGGRAARAAGQAVGSSAGRRRTATSRGA